MTFFSKIIISEPALDFPFGKIADKKEILNSITAFNQPKTVSGFLRVLRFEIDCLMYVERNNNPMTRMNR